MKYIKYIDLRVSSLVFIFGFGSWVGISGLWLEIPLLVYNLPEGPNLASNLSVALQAANISCVIYWLIFKKWPTQKTEDMAIHSMMAVGVASCLLLIFFWSETIMIANYPVSISLYILSFGISIVDTASSITFLPYMARFKSFYLTPFLAGEGMGGFIPSLVALAQGIEDTVCYPTNATNTSISNSSTDVVWIREPPVPRFPEEIFMLSLLALMTFSWAAFFLLNYHPLSQREKITSMTENDEVEMNENPSINPSSEDIIDSVKIVRAQKHNFILLFTLQFWSCLLTFGIFPALQPFSCLPYGNVAFHLSVTFAGMAYPCACLLALFIEIRSQKVLTGMTLFATAIAAYLLVTAVYNPFSPLKDYFIGKMLLVVCWTLFSGMFSYIKTMITVILSDVGHSALFNIGAITQAGGFLGAILMVVIVNYTDFFNDEICLEALS